MSLFKKNPNETAYVGGKKHWADVIKNSGDGNLLLWRQPEEDFNTNSTLIVMPGEEAIFIKGGNIEAVFSNGTYKLSTENYPFISRLRNAFTGGISTFNCVVYFVRKADSKEIFWGTDSPIQVRDKVWNVRTEAKARGAYRLRIENPAIFLTKMIGNNIFSFAQSDMNAFFQNEFNGKIKSAVSKFLNGYESELIGIEEHLEELSDRILPYIDEAVGDYGLKCIRFSLAGLDIEKTKYDQYDNMTMAANGKVINAQGDLGVMNILGDNWGKQQAANILGNLANNPGAGGVGAMGAGVGIGMVAGGTFGNMANQMFATMNQQSPQPLQSQNNTTDSESQGQSAPNEDPVVVLGKLKELLDKGCISQEAYDEKVKEVLGRM